MRHTLTMPKLGDSVTEVVILEWHVAPGDTVAVGDPLVAVETDKIDTDVPATDRRHRRRAARRTAGRGRHGRTIHRRRRLMPSMLVARRSRPSLRRLPRGLRAGRHVHPLAGQDDHRGRGPPVLPPDDGGQPAARRRPLAPNRDGGRAQRRGRVVRLRPAARHERARHLRTSASPISGPTNCATSRRCTTATRCTARPRCSRFGASRVPTRRRHPHRRRRPASTSTARSSARSAGRCSSRCDRRDEHSAIVPTTWSIWRR